MGRLSSGATPDLAAARRLLQERFGYPDFRGAQEAIVGHVLGGGDALVLMPTGGGKSLCYQLPSMLRPGVGVVVSPLIALMHDQVGALRQAGVRAAALNSMLEPAEAAAVERDLVEGRLDLVYVAPERLLTERFLALLDRTGRHRAADGWNDAAVRALSDLAGVENLEERLRNRDRIDRRALEHLERLYPG